LAGFSVKSLPAKRFARALSAVALAACGMSVCVHLIALLGSHSKSLLNFQLGLFVGIFVLFVPAYLAQERLLSEFSSRDRFRMFDPRFSSKVRLKILLANTPKWLRQMCNALLYYYIVFFVIFAYRTFPNKALSELDEILLFSSGTAVFYCGFAAILTSYARTEYPLRPDEI
jgi:hypothetical protein